MKKIPPHKIKNGFTLVELMVVLLIAGILAAVAIPVYNNYISNAKMSEGYNHIDAITKAQATFFINHKSFQFLNTMPRKVPSGKIEFLGDPSVGGYEVAVRTWDKIGTPIPKGTPVAFAYGAAGGKTNSSGVALTSGCTFDAGSDYNCFSTSATYVVPLETGSGSCSYNSTSFPGLVTSGPDKSDYAWNMIVGFANFKIKSSGDQCTAIVKLIDTDASGKLVAGRAVVVINKGE